MPTIRFQKDTPTIRQIWVYTWRIEQLRRRFDYMKRDILPSRIRLTERLTYSKDRPSNPDKKLIIQSFSAPQYYPYHKVKSKNAKRQRTVKHQYDITMSIQLDKNERFTFDSRIKWRVGGFKKWVSKPDQKLIQSVYRETREKLNSKYGEGSSKVIEEIKKIRKKGRYLNVGDYNARANGLNGEFFFTLSPLLYIYNCSYGRLWNKEPNTKKPFNEIKFPFFCKHSLAVLFYLMKRKILLTNK